MDFKDPLGNLSFAIECDGITLAFFKEVSGLESEIQAIEHREADRKGNEVIRKLPGQKKWGDITLKRGMTDDLVLQKWHKDVWEGKIQGSRKNGSIVIYNQAHDEVARWNFTNAWPSKVTGPSLQAGNNEIALESVIIVHEGIERVK